MSAPLSILFDDNAYAMLLFIISVSLSITMGLLGFVNLTHGAFTMAGCYVTVSLMNSAGWPFLLALPGAFVGLAVGSVILGLDQTLLSIGLAFIAAATMTFIYGPNSPSIAIPE